MGRSLSNISNICSQLAGRQKTPISEILVRSWNTNAAILSDAIADCGTSLWTVGPPFLTALEATFGANNVAAQGVNNYAAIGAEYCTGGSLTGSQNLAQVGPQYLRAEVCSF